MAALVGVSGVKLARANGSDLTVDEGLREAAQQLANAANNCIVDVTENRGLFQRVRRGI